MAHEVSVVDLDNVLLYLRMKGKDEGIKHRADSVHSYMFVKRRDNIRRIELS
jgi:hypothetical protein